MKTSLLLFLALLALASCGDNPAPPTDIEPIGGGSVGRDMPMPHALARAWNASTAAYLDLEEALVASDLPSARINPYYGHAMLTCGKVTEVR